MIKTLVVNGCSWTAGNELEQDPKFDTIIKKNGLAKQDPNDPINWNFIDANGNTASTYDDIYDLLNWAGCLKEKLGIEELINLSMGGGSNSRILRTTIDYVMSMTPKQCQETMIVIGWTLSDRDEINIGNYWHRWNTAQPFKMIVDRGLITDDLIEKVNKIHEDYILYILNENASIKRYFQHSYLLANLLENLGITYFFFNALPAWWPNTYVENDFGVNLVWHNNQRTILSNNDCMYNFIKNNALPKGQYGHPLAEAHSEWANYLLQIMQGRGIV